MNTLLYAGSAVPQLAQEIAQKAGIKMGLADLSVFPNQELRVHVLDNPEQAILIQSLAHPVDRALIQYCLLADALQQLGVKKIVGIVPYLGYSRQDKVFRPGEPLSAKVVATILGTTNTKSLITVDLHSTEISNFFSFPITTVSSHPVFSNYLQGTSLENTIIVSPDKGATEKNQFLAQDLNLPLALCAKNRDRQTGKVSIESINQSVSNKNIIIYDDMIATGDTLVELSQFLKTKGAARITVCAAHHLYIPGTQEKLDRAPIDHLVVTNSVQRPENEKSEKLIEVSIADLLAQKLQSLLMVE